MTFEREGSSSEKGVDTCALEDLSRVAAEAAPVKRGRLLALRHVHEAGGSAVDAEFQANVVNIRQCPASSLSFPPQCVNNVSAICYERPCPLMLFQSRSHGCAGVQVDVQV
jgi:hypothetical protein